MQCVFLNPVPSYRDQFEMLSESMAKERANTTIREKAQNKVTLS